MWILQDIKANEGNTKGKIVAVAFRLANLASLNKAYKILLFPYLLFYKCVFEWLLGFELPYNVKVGSGLMIFHIQSIVVNKATVIGRNCTLRHCTTIGNKESAGGCPVIGDNVNIGSNSCIIGPISIGNNVSVGAGSVVVKSVPNYAKVVGNPARILVQ